MMPAMSESVVFENARILDGSSPEGEHDRFIHVVGNTIAEVSNRPIRTRRPDGSISVAAGPEGPKGETGAIGPAGPAGPTGEGGRMVGQPGQHVGQPSACLCFSFPTNRRRSRSTSSCRRLAQSRPNSESSSTLLHRIASRACPDCNSDRIKSLASMFGRR